MFVENPNIFPSHIKCILTKLSQLHDEALTSWHGSRHPGENLGLEALIWFTDPISGKVSIGPLGVLRLHIRAKNVLQYGLCVDTGWVHAYQDINFFPDSPKGHCMMLSFKVSPGSQR